jgi:hypothetical protein
MKSGGFYDIIFLKSDMPPIDYTNNFLLIKHPETVPEEYGLSDYEEEPYECIIYNIKAENLSEEELIKIAESIH